MPFAIRAEGIGKRYRVGRREAYGALRDSLARLISAPFSRRRHRAGRAESADTIWALRDVSFDIDRGEVIGIVGRNGSGKSTLLKILSRITEPTTGSAEVRGRVGSLLEVGTGFHPELSGRENVFVNGAILGMRRVEIARQFDAIVAFAEVGRFIDTPIKHYSSGMQMRLAFSVAAHLQPDILLVDEVLAVGDAEFQRRCLGKMQDVSQDGRTVMLVSHQMGQIRRLCQRVVWLEQGRVKHIGAAGETIALYESVMLGPESEPTRGGCFVQWEIIGEGHTLRSADRPFTIRGHVNLSEPLVQGHYGIGILNDREEVIAGWAFEPLSLEAGRHLLDVTVGSLPIRPGTYRVSFALFNRGNNLTGGRLLEKWMASPVLTLDVVPIGHPQDEWAGILNVAADLSVRSAGGDIGVGKARGESVQTTQPVVADGRAPNARR